MLGIFKKSVEVIKYPIEGTRIPLTSVPDEVFSKKMLGDGTAILPQGSVVSAPCNCEVIQIFPTNHAIGLLTEKGIELLIHIGIDTVELKGNGFKRIASVGDKLKTGDPIVEIDKDVILQQGKKLETPIIITNMEIVKSIDTETGDDDILVVVLK